jgi:hypothetical protein
LRLDSSLSYAIAALTLICVSLYLSLIGPAVAPRVPSRPIAPNGTTVTLAQETSARVK